MDAKTATKIRKQMNHQLTSLPTYHESIPVDQIRTICDSFNAKMVQEDGTPWSGIFCGDDGDTSIHLDGFRFQLRLMWHKMDSGRYEITAYVM